LRKPGGAAQSSGGTFDVGRCSLLEAPKGTKPQGRLLFIRIVRPLMFWTNGSGSRFLQAWRQGSKDDRTVTTSVETVRVPLPRGRVCRIAVLLFAKRRAERVARHRRVATPDKVWSATGLGSVCVLWPNDVCSLVPQSLETGPVGSSSSDQPSKLWCSHRSRGGASLAGSMRRQVRATVEVLEACAAAETWTHSKRAEVGSGAEHAERWRSGDRSSFGDNRRKQIRGFLFGAHGRYRSLTESSPVCRCGSLYQCHYYCCAQRRATTPESTG
jgi:hypothetical protein